jgi:hypothetical protein
MDVHRYNGVLLCGYSGVLLWTYLQYLCRTDKETQENQSKIFIGWSTELGDPKVA